MCVAVLFVVLPADAEVVGRAPIADAVSGYSAFYDEVLDITWLGDANYARTTGFDQDGLMTWDEAQLWISSLNSNSHLGLRDWRLPEIIDVDNNGCVFAFSGSDCGWNVDLTTGEMAHLYYATLENLGQFDTEGVPPSVWGLQNSGPFINIEQGSYWSGTEHVLDSYAWEFDFHGRLRRDSSQRP